MKRFSPIVFLLLFRLAIALFLLAGYFVAPRAFAQDRQQGEVLNPDRNSKQNKEPSGATLLLAGGADDNGHSSYDGGDRTDWYKVQAQQDGELEVSVRNRIDGDLNLEVYGADQTTKLAESLTPETGNEELSFPIEAGQWYYLKVYANQAGDEGDYKIETRFYEEDLIPPQLKLERSGVHWTTNQSSFDVLGTVMDNRKISAIRIDDRDILSSSRLLKVTSGEARLIWHTISDLAVGENVVKIDVEDASGNRMSTVMLLIDRQLNEDQIADPAPVIEISDPENETRFRATQQIVIQGTVRDNEEVSRLLVNGQDIADDPWSGTQRLGIAQINFEYSFESIAYGVHEITVIAEDNRGSRQQETLMLYRDAPPEIVIDSPQKGEGTRDDTIRLYGRVKDDWNIARITVNGVELSDASISALTGDGMQQEFIYTVADLQYGENIISIEAEDDIGNLTTARISVERQELPPGIQITAPRHQEQIAQDSVLVEGSVSDPDGIAVLTVNAESAGLDESGSFRHQVANLPYGPSTIEVIATDTRGKSNRISVDISRVDRDPPAITIVKPENAGMRTKETFAEIRFEISDDDRVTHVEIDGKEEDGTSFPGGKKSFTRVIEDLDDGENLIELSARDVSGNVAHKVIAVHKISAPVIVVPGLTLTGLRTVDTSMPVRGFIRTEDQVASVNINGITVDVNTQEDNSFSFQAEQLKVGSNPLEIVVIDTLGGQTRKNLTITRVDTIEPDISIVILEGEKKTKQEKILLKVTVNDNDRIALVEIDGEEREGIDVAIDGPGEEKSYTHTVEHLNDGENLIRVIARDISGNLNEEFIRVYKVPPPEIRIVQREGTLETFTENMPIVGNIYTEADEFSVTVAGRDVAVDRKKENEFSYQVEELPLGLTELTIVATDSFGNQSQATLKIRRREPDDESGSDRLPGGAARLRIDDTIAEVSIDYNGDRTDWFRTYLHMKGEWALSIRNNISGDLDLELYASDVVTKLGESKTRGIGDERLNVNIEQEGVYYVRVIAHGPGDRGQYDISNQFIEADMTPPVLTISLPETEKIQLEVESMTIAGTVQDHSKIQELDISGEGLIIAREVEFNREETFAEFSYTILKGLQAGENVITVRAVDEAGNFSEHTQHVTLLVPPEPTQTPTEGGGLEHYLQKLRPGKVYAVIIGIGDYQSVQNLRFAVNDAQGFYDLLVDPDYGRVPETHIKLLLDQQATKRNIEAAIGTWLPERAGAEDTVFIYYAGHGETEEDVAYWVTHQSNIDDLRNTALNNNALSEMLNQIEAQRVITFLDSCYSAATANLRTLIIKPEIPFEKLSGEGRVIISASTGQQFSLELPEYRHGIFTYYLLEGLKGKADQNNNGVVDVDEIWNYVKYQVTETAEKAGNSQQPVFDAQKITAGIPLIFNIPFIQGELKGKNLQSDKPKTLELFD
ncbi:MAG: caspase family protein [bacterium]|nr:caspase family protein [bacterium]